MAAEGPNNSSGIRDIVNENKRIFGLVLERYNVINNNPNLATQAEKDLVAQTIADINDGKMEYFALGSKSIDLSNLNNKRADFSESSFFAKKIIGRPSRFEQMMQKIDNPNEHAANQNALIENQLVFETKQQHIIYYIQALSFIRDENSIAILLEEINEWGVFDDFIKDRESNALSQKIVELGSIHGVDLNQQAEQIAKIAENIYLKGANIYLQNRAEILDSVRKEASNIPKIRP